MNFDHPAFIIILLVALVLGASLLGARVRSVLQDDKAQEIACIAKGGQIIRVDGYGRVCAKMEIIK
jgi:hypothetical protein